MTDSESEKIVDDAVKDLQKYAADGKLTLQELLAFLKDFSDVPEERREEALQRADIREIYVREEWKAPIPSPKHLEEYERVLPGSPKIILDMAKGNAESRQYVAESKQYVEKENVKIKKILLVLSTICILSFMGCGVFLLSIDKDIAGYALLISIITPTLASIAKVLFPSRKSQNVIDDELLQQIIATLPRLTQD